MNAQLKILAAQATKYIKPTEDSGEGWIFDKEKFAELLILECVQAVMDGTKEGDHYAMRIENHFDHGEGGILRFVRCGEDNEQTSE